MVKPVTATGLAVLEPEPVVPPVAVHLAVYVTVFPPVTPGVKAMLAVASPGVAAPMVGAPGNMSSAAVRVSVVDDVFELPSEILTAAT